MDTWNHKIVGHDRVSPESLTFHPQNFRKHPKRQREALAAAIREVGFINSVTVNKTTGNVINGHARIAEAIETGQELIDVEYVELTEAEEAKALATFDRLSTMAEIDTSELDVLLREIETDDEALSKMLDEMAADAGIELERLKEKQTNHPEDFKEVGEDIATDYECPKCGYRWSGRKMISDDGDGVD